MVTEICHPSELPPIKRRVGIEKKERIDFIPPKGYTKVQFLSYL